MLKYKVHTQWMTVWDSVCRCHECDESSVCINVRAEMYICLQAKYIAECIDEIKLELRQDNMSVKANAVNKLTYVSTNS